MSLAVVLFMLFAITADQAPSLDPDKIHRRLENILSRPEFNQGNLNWILEAIRAFLDKREPDFRDLGTAT